MHKVFELEFMSLMCNVFVPVNKVSFVLWTLACRTRSLMFLDPFRNIIKISISMNSALLLK